MTALMVALVALTTVVTTAPVTPAPGGTTSSTPRIIANGHVDIGPRVVNGEWRIELRDDTTQPPTWREPSGVVLHAVDATKATVPNGTEFAFLGDPGANIWVLPQVQRPGVVWPGWNTQDPSIDNSVPGAVTWRLTEVTGPGRMSLFLTGAFGRPEVLFASDRPMPQHISVPLDTHAHGNWTFTATGVYRLTMEMSAIATDGRVLTDTAALTVAVGPTVDTAALAAAAPSPTGSPPKAPASVPSRAAQPGETADSAGGGWLVAIAAGGVVAFTLAWWLVRRLRRRRRPGDPVRGEQR